MERDKFIQAVVTVASAIIMLMLALIASIFLNSCTRTVYVPVEKYSSSVRTDSVSTAKASAMIIIERDTVAIDRSADTVRIDRVRWRTSVSTVHDTVTIIRTDTVRIRDAIPVNTVTVQSEEKSKVKKIFLLAAVLLMLAAAYRIVRFFRKQ